MKEENINYIKPKRTINELEKDSSAANRDEILLLNAELDYILSVLRRK